MFHAPSVGLEMGGSDLVWVERTAVEKGMGSPVGSWAEQMPVRERCSGAPCSNSNGILSYRMSSEILNGWNTTSKVSASCGAMNPSTGLIVKSAAHADDRHVNLVPMSPVFSSCRRRVVRELATTGPKKIPSFSNLHSRPEAAPRTTHSTVDTADTSKVTSCVNGILRLVGRKNNSTLSVALGGREKSPAGVSVMSSCLRAAAAAAREQSARARERLTMRRVLAVLCPTRTEPSSHVICCGLSSSTRRSQPCPMIWTLTVYSPLISKGITAEKSPTVCGVKVKLTSRDSPLLSTVGVASTSSHCVDSAEQSYEISWSSLFTTTSLALGDSMPCRTRKHAPKSCSVNEKVSWGRRARPLRSKEKEGPLLRERVARWFSRVDSIMGWYTRLTIALSPFGTDDASGKMVRARCFWVRHSKSSGNLPEFATTTCRTTFSLICVGPKSTAIGPPGTHAVVLPSASSRTWAWTA
mmetsp:Transcript_21547/g.51030  ORF Transcript_21547/g.51030 Transcript_21547/m.51030 type:complete len:468 (-) Transcript_21547:422-1825(-)